jgi:predicted ester cyclase
MKFANLAAMVLGATIFWQSYALSQDRAQPPSAATAQPMPSPKPAAGPSDADNGINPSSPPTNGLQQNQPSERQGADAMPRKYVEMWNSGDLRQIETMFARPAFITFHGKRGILDIGNLARVIGSWRKSMPDLNFKIEDTVVQGDHVAMRLTFSGSYKERLFPNTAAPEAMPRKIQAIAMLMFLVHDGQIAEVWDDYDELVMRYEMGAIWRSNEQLGGCSCKPDAGPTPLSP